MLAIFIVANVATEFWAIIKCMFLQFSHGLPDYFTLVACMFIALVWKLTKVDSVLQYFVNVLHEIAFAAAIWAGYINI